MWSLRSRVLGIGGAPESVALPARDVQNATVLVSREQLDAMLRFVQETLAEQKQLLVEVRAIEQHLELSESSSS